MLPDSATLDKVKAEIIKKNKKVMIKNLFISEKQCLNRIIRLYIGGDEHKGSDSVKLSSLEILNGTVKTLTVRFVRALAILSEK